MYILALLLGLMSFLISAAPTVRPPIPPFAPLSLKSIHPIDLLTPTQLSPRQGAGTYIFKDQNLSGQSTFIPGNAYCADLYNIGGNFDNAVRSVRVMKGYRCNFHVYV
jgi:hypothetical protein